ncbi:MAG: response regulator [Polyangiaceae bacterium]
MSHRERESAVVLVADDDDDFRAAVVAVLRMGGHATLEARDGEELLEVLERHEYDTTGLRPDVLITDVKMPKLSGLGVLEALRGVRLNMAVVVLTALSDGSIDMVARRLGACGVLHKPLEPDALLAAVRDARGRALVG